MERDLHVIMQQYIDGTLSAEERAAFEVEMEKNPDLKEDYQLLLDMEKELENKELGNFRSELNKVMESEAVHVSTESAQPPARIFPFKTISIAASILLLVAGGWWFYQIGASNDSPNLIAIAQEYNIPFKVPPSRGEIQNEKIYDHYKNGDYTLAAKELELYANANNDNEAKLYAAISYLAIKQTEKALPILDNIPDTPALKNKKAYYQGIAYLQKSDEINAASSFESVNVADEFFYKKAQEILKLLK